MQQGNSIFRCFKHAKASPEPAPRGPVPFAHLSWHVVMQVAFLSSPPLPSSLSVRCRHSWRKWGQSWKRRANTQRGWRAAVRRWNAHSVNPARGSRSDWSLLLTILVSFCFSTPSIHVGPEFQAPSAVPTYVGGMLKEFDLRDRLIKSWSTSAPRCARKSTSLHTGGSAEV